MTQVTYDTVEDRFRVEIKELCDHVYDMTKLDARLVYVDPCGVEFSIEQEEVQLHVKCLSEALFYLMAGENRVAEFKFSHLPGSNLIWSSGAIVFDAFRKKGIGKRLSAIRIKLAQLFYATGLVCSVGDWNSRQIKILEDNGWKKGANINGAYIYTHDLTLKK